MTVLKRGCGVMLQVSLSSSHCVLSLSKNVLLFPRLPFHLPELSFYCPELHFHFPEIPFCFSERPFYFSKKPYCFPEFPLSFPQVPYFYLLASFSKNDFFLGNCTFLSCSDLLREIIFALLFWILLEKLQTPAPQTVVECMLSKIVLIMTKKKFSLEDESLEMLMRIS